LAFWFSFFTSKIKLLTDFFPTTNAIFPISKDFIIHAQEVFYIRISNDLRKRVVKKLEVANLRDLQLQKIVKSLQNLALKL